MLLRCPFLSWTCSISTVKDKMIEATVHDDGVSLWIIAIITIIPRIAIIEIIKDYSDYCNQPI